MTTFDREIKIKKAFNTDKVLRTAAYIRVSHDEQVKHGFSIEAQKEGLQKYAEERGYRIVEWYIDEGKSARKKTSKRKEYLRLIEDAKQEAIENILEASRYKSEGRLKLLVVTGCLAERYRDDITEEIPEVDVCVGIGSNSKIAEIVKNAIEGKRENCYGQKEELDLNGDRILGGYPFSTYLKIADGCDNCCTYCAIPQIRGRFRSRKIENIIEEVRELAAGGVTEIVGTAQDTTAYGIDIYGEYALPRLLRELCKVEGIRWIRTLYTYPDKITDELLEVLSSEPKLVKYLDIPIQHVDGEILKRMNRNGDEEYLSNLIDKIRAKIPEITLRNSSPPIRKFSSLEALRQLTERKALPAVFIASSPAL